MSGQVRFKVVEQNGQEIVQEIHKVTVHAFSVGDVEDPEIYAAEPIWKWQQTDSGKFVMEHAVETPSYHQQLDYNSFGYRYAIVAELESKKLSEFYLRWGKHGNN
jgi:hypothetical protein